MTFQSRYGGMCDLDNRPGDGQFSRSINLDTRNTDGIKLHKKPVRLFQSDTPIKFIKETDEGNVFFFSESGKIYNVNGTLMYDFGIEPLNVAYFQERFVIAYRDSGTLKFAGIDENGSSNPHIGVSSWSLTGDYIMGKPYDMIPMLNISDDHLFVGARRAILRFSPTGGSAEKGIYQVAISFERNIVGITSSGEYILVILDNGRVYVWDGFSEEYDTFQDNNVYVRYTFTHNNQTWLLGGFNDQYSELYVLEGLMIRPIKTIRSPEGIDSNKKFDFDHQVLASHNGFFYHRGHFYMGGQDKIISFGEGADSLPFGFENYIGVDSQGNEIETVFGLYKHLIGTRGYASLRAQDSNYYVEDILNTSGYIASGTIYSPIYSKKDFNIGDKRANVLKVQYDDCDTVGAIDIYYSLDGGAYTLLTTIEDAERQFAREDQYEIIRASFLNDTFFKIRFKVVLRTSNSSTTPIFYGIFPEYEQATRQ